MYPGYGAPAPGGTGGGGLPPGAGASAASWGGPPPSYNGTLPYGRSRALQGQQHHPQQQQQQQQQQHGMNAMLAAMNNGVAGHASSNNLRAAELQQEKKQAAAARRQEQQSREAAAKDELLFEAPGLFEKPQKVVQNDGQLVSQILGEFKDAHKVINSSSSCIGIDYQPQTPAPVQHIIGEEEEEPKPRRPPTLPRPSSSRLPEDISQTHRPVARQPRMGPPQQQQQQQQQVPHSSSAAAMPPPPTSIMPQQSINSHHLQKQQQMRQQMQQEQQLMQPHHSTSFNMPPPTLSSSSNAISESYKRSNGVQQQSAILSPLGDVPSPAVDNHSETSRVKQAGRNLPKISVDEPSVVEDTRLQEMLREMKDPLAGGQDLMPPPLTAIITPRITEHEGNNSSSVPRYFATPNLLMQNDDNMKSPPLQPKASTITPVSSSSLSSATPSSRAPFIPVPTSAAATTTLSEESDSDHAENVQTSELNGAKENNKTSENSNSQSESSSDESSSEDSSSEDPEPDANEFSLANLAKKANISKFSPSSSVAAASMTPASQQPQPSPLTKEVIKTTPSPAHSPTPAPPQPPPISVASTVAPTTTTSQEPKGNEEEPISELLTNSGGILPDIDLFIREPLSPMRPSPVHGAAAAAAAPPPPPPPPPRPASTPSSTSVKNTAANSSSSSVRHSRRRSSAVPSMRDESSDDDDEPIVPKKRTPKRKPKVKLSEDTVRPKRAAAKIPVSTVKLSSSDDDDDDDDDDDKSDLDKKVKPKSKARVKTKIKEETPQPQPPVVPIIKESDTSPVVASNKKKMALGNIFGVKTASSKSGKGKDGIKIVKRSETPLHEKPTPAAVSTATTTGVVAPTPAAAAAAAAAAEAAAAAAAAAASVTETEPKQQKQRNQQKKKAIKQQPAQRSPQPQPKKRKGNKDHHQHHHRQHNLQQRPRVMCRIPLRNISQRTSYSLLQNVNKANNNSSSGSNISASSNSKENLQTSLFGEAEQRERRQSGGSSSSSRRSSKKRSVRENDTVIKTEERGEDNKRIKLEYEYDYAPPPHAPTPIESSQANVSQVGPPLVAAPPLTAPPQPPVVVTTAPPPPPPPTAQQQQPAATDYLSNGDQKQWGLMPPPKMFYSYLEQYRDEEEDKDEDHNAYMMEAKRLKHEADKETDREQQAMKYLQAVLFFSLCGNITERTGEKSAAFVMYNETLSLIRHVCRPFKNSEFGTFDNKLAVLSLRCQSLLYLKLYKMRRHELKECQKIIGDHIMKANASQQNSPSSTNTISPTPSPAGSEGSVCSKSSGYTSSGEINSRYTGVLTPPTNPPVCLSVPQSVMKKQHQFCNYLSQCHELWEQADMYAHRGHCEEFIIRLDQMCGPLTLHSSLKDLVKYIRAGLNYLSKEKENAAAAAAAAVVTAAPTGGGGGGSSSSSSSSSSSTSSTASSSLSASITPTTSGGI